MRLRQPQTGITDVPSLAARQGAPAALQPFLNTFPIPNGPIRFGPGNVPSGFAQFATSFSTPSSLNATSIRIDHTISQRVTLFGRYNYAPSASEARGANGSLNNPLTTSFGTQTFTFGSNWVASHAINNDLRVNYSRNRGSLLSSMDNLGGAVPIPDAALFPSFVTPGAGYFGMTLIGGTNSGFSVGRLGNNLQRQINLIDSVSLVEGRHQLKAGVDYRRLFPVFRPLMYQLGPTFSGIGLTDPAVGTVFSGRASNIYVEGDAGSRYPLFTNLSLYAQDAWRSTTRLSVTYGLRWDYNPPPGEAQGNLAFAGVGLDNPPLRLLLRRRAHLSGRHAARTLRLALAWHTRSQMRGGARLYCVREPASSLILETIKRPPRTIMRFRILETSRS